MRAAGCCAGVALACSLAWAAPQKQKDTKKSEPGVGYTRLRIEVTGGEKERPIDNASVYVRFPPEGKPGSDKLLEMNLKTNQEGVTLAPRLPRGKVLIQVHAKGWKTFGKWYDLDEEQKTIRIRLEEPTRWY